MDIKMPATARAKFQCYIEGSEEDESGDCTFETVLEAALALRKFFFQLYNCLEWKTLGYQVCPEKKSLQKLQKSH